MPNTETTDTLLDQLDGYIDAATVESRDFTPEEQIRVDALMVAIQKSNQDIQMPYQAVPPASPAVHTANRTYSLTRAIASAMQLPGSADAGLEREVANELANRNPHKSWAGTPVPWNVLYPSKANAGAVGGNANPLTGEQYLESLLSIQGDAMPREFLSGRAGGRMETCSELSAVLPQVTGKISADTYTLDSDVTASDADFDQQVVTPVTCGSRTVVKRSIVYAKHPQADAILRQQVANAIVEEMDKVWLGPTAGAPDPDGLLDLATAAALTDVPATLAGWLAFRDELLTYLAKPESDSSLRFIMPAALSDLLKTTGQWATNTGGSAIITDGFIDGTQVLPSHLLDISTLTAVPVLVGDFSTMTTVLFNQGGADVIANPWADSVWPSGSFELRALLDYSVCAIDAARIMQSAADATPV